MQGNVVQGKGMSACLIHALIRARLQAPVEVCHQGSASGLGAAQEMVDTARPLQAPAAAPEVSAAIPTTHGQGDQWQRDWQGTMRILPSIGS